MRPVETRFSLKSNFRKGKNPNGIDFACPEGTPCVAAHDSIVGIARDSGDGLGKRIWLYTELPNATIRICYAYLSRLFVTVGTHVKEGQVIGLTGSHGRNRCLHLEVRLLPEDRPVKPDFYRDENVKSILRSLKSKPDWKVA